MQRKYVVFRDGRQLGPIGRSISVLRDKSHLKVKISHMLIIG